MAQHPKRASEEPSAFQPGPSGTARAVRTVLCAHALVAAMSCAGSHTSPPAVVAGQFPPAHIEWLLGPGALLNAVGFANAGVGAAVGELGAILVTADAGVTWTVAKSETDRALRGVAFADATTGVAVGAGGTALATTNA